MIEFSPLYHNSHFPDCVLLEYFFICLLYCVVKTSLRLFPLSVSSISIEINKCGGECNEKTAQPQLSSQNTFLYYYNVSMFITV